MVWRWAWWLHWNVYMYMWVWWPDWNVYVYMCVAVWLSVHAAPTPVPGLWPMYSSMRPQTNRLPDGLIAGLTMLLARNFLKMTGAKYMTCRR